MFFLFCLVFLLLKLVENDDDRRELFNIVKNAINTGNLDLERNSVFATNSNFQVILSLQPNGVNLRFFDPIEFKGLRHWVAGLEKDLILLLENFIYDF